MFAHYGYSHLKRKISKQESSLQPNWSLSTHDIPSFTTRQSFTNTWKEEVSVLTAVGIPEVHYFGAEGDYNVMILDLLGPSLEDLKTYCTNKFTTKTVLMIADQLVQRMEYIHNKNFLHWDIKPDNFLIGLGKKQHIIYAIDFGLAKWFRDPRSGEHIPYRDGKSLTGTAWYASANTHLGVEQSWRDDMESVGFVLVYFLKGKLPWQGLPAKSKNAKYDKIKEKKVATKIDELAKGCPKEI